LKKNRPREERLLEELMRLRKQIDSITGKSKYTENLRIKMKLARIKKRVAEINRELDK